MEDFDMGLDSLLKELQEEFNIAPRKHIIAVDDDRNVLKLIKDFLGDKYEVTTMANGLMALNYFRNKTCDLIFLDYEMPGMSGADVLKKLRENENTKDIPVVFLTGVSDNQKVKEIMSMGVHDYILKPINVERLRADAKKILG